MKLADGDSLVLVAGAVRKNIHGTEHVMLGFNGAIPGPLLWVDRGTSVKVRFVNGLDQPSTIHWHGLRHDYRMDGVPGLSQEPVPPGGSFEYTLHFPDAGLYWYHPHVREEMQQDLGLSGNIVVRGMEGLPPVSREEILLLDDILINDQDEIVPYGREAPTHALMGRFGNILLINGETRWTDSASSGETIRLWFTNAANTRTFNLSVTNASMTLVAGDMGAFDQPTPVESVVLAPAERYAVDVTLHGDGPWVLENRVRAIDHLYGRFVAQVDTIGTLRSEIGDRRPETGDARIRSVVAGDAVHSRLLPALRSPVSDLRSPQPDLTLEFGLRTRNLPFVVERMMLLDSAYFHPVEWSGTMPMMNWATTGLEAEWFVRDAATGRENEAATFTVKRGEQRVIRLVNLRNTLHAMQHPIHLHGQRFRVLTVNGVPPPVSVWKDTVLLPAGATVDILVEFTNPGHWMLHCHIAEHMEAGMMTHFVVDP
ncbi:MAG TPA: multicopper oxidase family protein [Gemmatimonadales bacterium]|nr:multicopper oxidase family protein [Gemmatimonadales bacterium]